MKANLTSEARKNFASVFGASALGLLAAMGGPAQADTAQGVYAHSRDFMHNYSIAVPAAKISGAFSHLEIQGVALTKDQELTRQKIDARLHDIQDHSASKEMAGMMIDTHRREGAFEAHKGKWTPEGLKAVGDELLALDGRLHGVVDKFHEKMKAAGASEKDAELYSKGILVSYFASYKETAFGPAFNPEEVVKAAPVLGKFKPGLLEETKKMEGYFKQVEALGPNSAATLLEAQRRAAEKAQTAARKSEDMVQLQPWFAVEISPREEVSRSVRVQPVSGMRSSATEAAAEPATEQLAANGVEAAHARLPDEATYANMASSTSEVKSASAASQAQEPSQADRAKPANGLREVEDPSAQDAAKFAVNITQPEQIPVHMSHDRVPVHVSHERVPVQISHERVAVKITRSADALDNEKTPTQAQPQSAATPAAGVSAQEARRAQMRQNIIKRARSDFHERKAQTQRAKPRDRSPDHEI